MKLETYTRKPFHVSAVQVTQDNMAEVAERFGGTILQETKTFTDDTDETKTKKKQVPFIKVDVYRPLNARQTKAFPGDWVLESDAGLKIYTQTAFDNAFALSDEVVYTEAQSQAHVDSSTEDIYEQDRNARAYGWAVGRGEAIEDVVQTTSDNPFLEKDWANSITVHDVGVVLAEETPQQVFDSFMEEATAQRELAEHQAETAKQQAIFGENPVAEDEDIDEETVRARLIAELEEMKA